MRQSFRSRGGLVTVIGIGFFAALTFFFLVHNKVLGQSIPTVTYSGTNGFAVTMPDVTQTLSGEIPITAAINQASLSSDNRYIFIVDGVSKTIGDGGSTSPITDTFDTTTIPNGQHTIYVWGWANTANGIVTYGSWGPITFTTNNAHALLGLQANYRELYLTLGQSAQLSAFFAYDDDTKIPTTASYAITSSEPVSNVASVSSNGMVTANAVGDATVTLSANGLTRDVRVSVNTQNVTPHFGKNDSFLTAYDPSESLYIRSMFFLSNAVINSDPAYPPALAAAAVNTFEDGIYFAPNSGTPDVNSWESYVNQNVFAPIQATAQANNMYVLYTGEGMTRGSDPLYNASRGPSASWSPNPIVYSFTQALSIGRGLGVEMGDEINSSWGNTPSPNGAIGQELQQIACVNNVCTGTWNNSGSKAGGNGAGLFIITGSNDPNLNRTVSNPYAVQSYTPSSFTFTATIVGTKTYTAATDPGLAGCGRTPKNRRRHVTREMFGTSNWHARNRPSTSRHVQLRFAGSAGTSRPSAASNSKDGG